MEIEQTNNILKKLKDKGFQILSFGNSFENPYEIIDEDYFNEVVNEAIDNN